MVSGFCRKRVEKMDALMRGTTWMDWGAKLGSVCIMQIEMRTQMAKVTRSATWVRNWKTFTDHRKRGEFSLEGSALERVMQLQKRSTPIGKSTRRRASVDSDEQDRGSQSGDSARSKNSSTKALKANTHILPLMASSLHRSHETQFLVGRMTLYVGIQLE